jgi:transcriptional regulator with XRE-family HTH domain
MINIKNERVIKAFGRNLREIRVKHGISQEELANEANIPLSQIGRIERGEINTTISSAYAIAASLKINISDLFDFAT